MNRTHTNNCQLETIDPIAVRFHRIFLALVFTGILYFHVEPNQQHGIQAVMAHGASFVNYVVMVHESQVK